MPSKRSRSDASAPGSVLSVPSTKLPATSDVPTLHVLVTGLARPFSVPAFKAMVCERSGVAVSEECLLMSDLRTYSLVTLPSLEVAARLTSELHDKAWPAGAASRLAAAYTAVSAQEHAAALAEERAQALTQPPQQLQLPEAEEAEGAEGTEGQAEDRAEARGSSSSSSSSSAAAAAAAATTEEEEAAEGEGARGDRQGEAAASARDKKLAALSKICSDKCARSGLSVASEVVRAQTGSKKAFGDKERSGRAIQGGELACDWLARVH